ncbi:ABC transporter [Marmoricola endophyticus]|uniref:ABC transporter n=1 Tax=Marmoricola endophyticus TaxID=2040280 RepID=A0A917F7G0_9ACTN|nr:GTPase domain-containing protein [Marmoricola endophyticus]GGF57836.1 ABC transporter [Marmoricola endophyticus]
MTGTGGSGTPETSDPTTADGLDGTESPMLAALVRLRDALRRNALPLDIAGAEDARVAREELVHQLDDYVLPRLVRFDAPLLVVVGGSTGAGKSTLVNSLVGTRVTVPGVLRPTTRSPVLVHHPDDARWFGAERVLPGLERTEQQTNDQGALQLVATTAMPPGLAMLDAPDVDSVEESNRVLAAQLLAAADLWLFVTTAARYADQVPWDYLRMAADRSASVAIVLDRTAPDAVAEVRSHLARMLTARGLSDCPLFVVEEVPVGGDGLLPVRAVDQVRDWLADLAQDQDARAVVVKQTLEGALRSISQRAHLLADAAAEQIAVRGRLQREVDQSYADAAAAVDEATADGTLLRGEVLARWQEFVGTGELLQGLESKVSWLRDRIGNAVRGRPQQAGRVSTAVESGLQTLLLERAEEAAERVAAAWEADPAGRVLLEDGGRDLTRASRSFRADAERAVREWQQGVLDMVRSEGADKRTSARFLAYGVNGLGVALMVVVFASTAGVTGAEVGIAGASAVVGKKLLEAVFGDQAVRRLAAAARSDLGRRVDQLLEVERERYGRRLETVAVPLDGADEIRQATRTMDDERFAQKTAEQAAERAERERAAQVEDLL